MPASPSILGDTTISTNTNHKFTMQWPRLDAEKISTR
jgi:hypothetical protein